MPNKRNRGLRGTWGEEQLQRAIQAVQDGTSVNAASKSFLIPRRTLRDYLKQKRTAKCAMGRKPILSTEAELDLCRRIIRLSEIGYPITSRVVRRCVYTYCETNNLEHPFNNNKQLAGRYWLQAFFARHQEIRNRKAQNMNPARAQKMNKFIVNDHFTKLRDVLNNLDIMNRPECIYNMDEKGCRLSLHHQQSVLAKKGAKRVHIVANEHGENVTIVACGNAIGSAIPPAILFKGKRMKPEWVDTLPPGSMALMTDKGSMTIEKFKEWLRHFAKYKVAGSCLLIFDGAKCHLDHSIVNVADELGITLYCLPSNTTHELQPMDKAVFRSFEHFWDDEVLKYWTQYKDRSITKQRFGHIFSIVWDKSLTPSNIKAGFSATGIYPFNPDIIPPEAFAPSTVTEIAPPVHQDAPERPLPSRAGPSGVVRKRQTVPPEESSDSEASETATETTLKPPPPTHSSYSEKKLHHLLSGSSSSSDDDNQDVETSSDEDNENENKEQKVEQQHETSFSDMLNTPIEAHKYNTRQRKPAINSRAQVVTKTLFGRSNSGPTAATSKSTVSSKTINPQKRERKPAKTKDDQGWYCKACKESRVADMRLCAVCKSYMHDECLGLTEEDEFEAYICPFCS